MRRVSVYEEAPGFRLAPLVTYQVSADPKTPKPTLRQPLLNGELLQQTVPD